MVKRWGGRIDFPLFTPYRDDISGPNGTGKTRAEQGLNLALPNPRVHCH
jgi:hypothetical protein